MAINRSEFFKAVNIVKEVELIDADLSEFFDLDSVEYKERYDKWQMTGLMVKDFILMNHDLWR